MLTDSERFAFTPRRIHGFASTGNAYDATQTDDRIASGHAADPAGRRRRRGPLLALCRHPGDGQTPWRPTQGARDAGDFAAAFNISTDDIAAAIALAQALGFAIDPALAALTAPAA
jgi:hypothetical protein